MARVTSDSAVLASRCWSRRSHRVCAQISPSACTSGPPVDRGRSRRRCSRPVPAPAVPGTLADGDADRAVERLGADQVLAARRRTGRRAPRRSPWCRSMQPLVDQEVHGVPVAPRLAHRAGLDVAQRRDAVGVDDQAVGQAVGVLVVDDVGLVAAVGGDERVLRRSGAGLVEQVHLHPRRLPSGGVPMLALSMWSPSGRPLVGVGAVERLAVDGVVTPSKLPAAAVKPIGAALRWSWNLLTRKKTCVAALVLRWSARSSACSGPRSRRSWRSRGCPPGWKVCRVQSQLCARSPGSRLICSVWSATLFAFTSA